ncbi:uncharacterized protein Bfra_006126, partial [Botrytis fragariae]
DLEVIVEKSRCSLYTSTTYNISVDYHDLKSWIKYPPTLSHDDIFLIIIAIASYRYRFPEINPWAFN